MLGIDVGTSEDGAFWQASYVRRCPSVWAGWSW